MNIRRFVITALKRFRQTYDESMPMPTLQQIADNEGGTSVIKKERTVGDKTEKTETKIGSGSYSIKTSNDKDADYNELNVTNLSILMRARASNKLSSAIVGPYQFGIGNSSDAINITVNNNTDKCDVTLTGRMGDAFREALDVYTKAQTDERIAATTAAMNTALEAKQNTLVSGTNIKTVGGQSLLGGGDIAISGGGRVVVGEERLLGEWVEDGVTYDRYEKVVNFGALPNAAMKTVAHGVANIYRFAKVYGEATSSSANNSIAIPFISGDGTLFTYLGVGKNNISITTNSDRSGFNAYVYLEFLRARS